MTQEPHTCPIRTIHHGPRVVSWATLTDGHWWLSSDAATIADDSCLLYAGPARAAAEVRDRRAWTQRRHIRLCLGARLRHASISRTPPVRLRWSSTDRYGRLLGGAPDSSEVVVRRRGPTTGARAPVARVPESSSLVLGSTHCQQRTQRATRASTLMHSTADFSAAPPRSRLRGPHA